MNRLSNPLGPASPDTQKAFYPAQRSLFVNNWFSFIRLTSRMKVDFHHTGQVGRSPWLVSNLPHQKVHTPLRLGRGALGRLEGQAHGERQEPSEPTRLGGHSPRRTTDRLDDPGPVGVQEVAREGVVPGLSLPQVGTVHLLQEGLVVAHPAQHQVVVDGPSLLARADRQAGGVGAGSAHMQHQHLAAPAGLEDQGRQLRINDTVDHEPLHGMIAEMALSTIKRVGKAVQ